MKKNLLILLILTTIILTACGDLDSEKIRNRQHLPGKDFVANVSQGAILFDNNCARCHGPDGKGTEQGPPLVNKIYRSGHHADLTFHWAVKDGVKQHHWHFGDMPPISGVSPEDAGHIIAFIRDEQRKSGIK